MSLRPGLYRREARSDVPSGRCARVSVGGVDLGCFGQIHPLARPTATALTARFFAAELNFTALLSLQLPEKTYTPLPKYPAVTRDIAVRLQPVAVYPTVAAPGSALLRSVGAVRYLPRQASPGSKERD